MVAPRTVTLPRVANEVDLGSIFNVSEFEAIARARMDPASFDYFAGGAWDEITVEENLAAFRRHRLRPRVLAGNAAVDASTTMLGSKVSMPLGLAPAAMHRLADPGGEVSTARAAGDAGVVMCLSTWSNCSLEEVAAQATGPLWLQLYVHEDRGLAEEMVRRASVCGFAAVVLTVDLAMPGYRERDFRNRFSPPADFGNVGDVAADEMQKMVAAAHDRSLSWEDLRWLTSLSELPLVLKGVLTGEDAALAVEHGAAAVWVSNHGGRQLDRSPAAIDVLEEVVAAVDGRAEVYVDGGVRRGLDVIAALALGATAAFIARPYLYALAAAGREGVLRCLELLQGELEMGMALLGVSSVSEIGRRHLV